MKRGDIIEVELPDPQKSEGHVQLGKRPALVVHNNETINSLSVIMIVPITKHLSALQYSYTIRVEPSFINGLDVPSVLLVNQLRAIDRSVVVGLKGSLEPAILKKVETEIRKLLSL